MTGLTSKDPKASPHRPRHRKCTYFKHFKWCGQELVHTCCQTLPRLASNTLCVTTLLNIEGRTYVILWTLRRVISKERENGQFASGPQAWSVPAPVAPFLGAPTCQRLNWGGDSLEGIGGVIAGLLIRPEPCFTPFQP